MDGLSAVANATAVVSISIQLADSIKKLYEFWDSVQEAPEDIQNIRADLELLTTVLSDITLEAQHQPPDGTLITVLKQCTVKVGALTAMINEIEPGFASHKCSVRKWNAIKAVFKDKKLKKLQTTIEGLKATLILAQQNVYGRLNRSQSQNLENRLIDLHQGLSAMSLRCCSEEVSTITKAPFETNQHLEALRAEILRLASSFSNPVYRYGFERAASKALTDSFDKPETDLSECGGVEEASLFAEKRAEMIPGHSSIDYKTWRKDLLSYRNNSSKHIFGIMYVVRKTFSLQSCQPDKLPATLEACQYIHQTSFAFHPAWWLIKLGFNYGLRLGLDSSYYCRWKSTVEIARAVPDDALLFEFCRKGNLDGVRSLLSRGEASVRDVDSHGRTALFFAATNALPELCEFLIIAGADKRSRTYNGRLSPITAAASVGKGCRATEIEDRAKIFRLFEDSMDFSDGGCDGWDALWTLAERAVYLNNNYTMKIPILLWALRFFSLEIRTNSDKREFALVLDWIVQLRYPEEALNVLLSPDSNLIDAVDQKDGYTTLLKRMSYAEPTEGLQAVLKKRPNLHYAGLDFDKSPYIETSTSLSLYSSWAFDLWRKALAKLQVNIDDFVSQELEMENSVLVNAGWKKDTLVALFNYEFEVDYYSFQCYRECGKCHRWNWSTPSMVIRVEPYWIQRAERIKRGLDPHLGPEHHSETNDSLNDVDDMYDARSTWSEESETDREQHISEVIENRFDTPDQLSEVHEESNEIIECEVSEEDQVQNDVPVISDSNSGILDRVYDRDLIVCIWCWIEHEDNGFKWTDEDNESMSHKKSIDYARYPFRASQIPPTQWGKFMQWNELALLYERVKRGRDGERVRS